MYNTFWQRNIMTSLLDFIYPLECLKCAKPISFSRYGFLCPSCISEIKNFTSETSCRKCAMPVLDTKEGKKYCPQCDGRNYSFTRAIACIDYKRDGKEIIHELKFSGRLRLCKPLAGELANRIKIEIDKFPDVIIPVPIHPHRSKVRGFNQSEKLGRELSKLLGLKQDINVLHKIKDTVPQSTLGKQERLKNPKGAYRADNSKFNYKTCILLDDVMTTGATLSECSSVLRKAGFKRIYAAVVAR